MGRKANQVFQWLKQVNDQHGERLKKMSLEEIYNEGKERAGNALKKIDEKRNEYKSKKK